MAWAHLILLLLWSGIGLQSLAYYPQLPPVVASHFDAAGTPNGWQSKAMFFGIYWGVSLLMTLAFYALPVLLRRLPVAVINLPHRDYWLAPERRQESLASLAVYMHWFGNAMIGLLLVTFELAIEANLRRQNLPPDAMWALLAGFLIFTGAWLVRLYRRFARPG
jgi:hypothetical protein